MSSSREPKIRLVTGDILKSDAQTLVNTVNCVGVMGKGIALAFKRRYPDMYRDYVKRCDLGKVRLGRPYLYQADDHLILNFPTKKHWRAVSRLEDIVTGLEYLEEHYREWGITSLAVPPLGCGNGQLEWDVVGPTLYRHLARLDIPVELYPPRGVVSGHEQLELLGLDDHEGGPPSRFVEPQWVAIVAILDRLERQPHHWPIGRIMFQKLVYFATQAGLPTGLSYEAKSYGPFADDVKRMIGRLQNNGLAVERQRGQMFEVTVGPTYADAVDRYRDALEPWRPIVDRTVDLMARLSTQEAEAAASVHFAAATLQQRWMRNPTSQEVIAAVEKWKIRRTPPLTRQVILEALVTLALHRWIQVDLDEELQSTVEDLVLA